jgi:hypothetical protein
MFAIFKRHAASGAALMFTSGPSAGEMVGSYRGEPLYPAGLDRAEYRALCVPLSSGVGPYGPRCSRNVRKCLKV